MQIDAESMEGLRDQDRIFKKIFQSSGMRKDKDWSEYWLLQVELSFLSILHQLRAPRSGNKLVEESVLTVQSLCVCLTSVGI